MRRNDIQHTYGHVRKAKIQISPRIPVRLDNQWCIMSSCEQRRLIRIRLGIYAGQFETSLSAYAHNITKTCLYNSDPFIPHFYTVKLGFTGVYIIVLISAQNINCGYSLESLCEAVLTSTHNLCFGQKYEQYPIFYLKKFIFWW